MSFPGSFFPRFKTESRTGGPSKVRKDTPYGSTHAASSVTPCRTGSEGAPTGYREEGTGKAVQHPGYQEGYIAPGTPRPTHGKQPGRH